jgi:hypothetical protein
MRLAILATVARLHPVAACTSDQDIFFFSIVAMLELRFASSARPLYRPSAFAFACPSA